MKATIINDAGITTLSFSIPDDQYQVILDHVSHHFGYKEGAMEYNPDYQPEEIPNPKHDESIPKFIDNPKYTNVSVLDAIGENVEPAQIINPAYEYPVILNPSYDASIPEQVEVTKESFSWRCLQQWITDVVKTDIHDELKKTMENIETGFGMDVKVD